MEPTTILGALVGSYLNKVRGPRGGGGRGQGAGYKGKRGQGAGQWCGAGSGARCVPFRLPIHPFCALHPQTPNRNPTLHPKNLQLLPGIVTVSLLSALLVLLTLQLLRRGLKTFRAESAGKRSAALAAAGGRSPLRAPLLPPVPEGEEVGEDAGVGGGGLDAAAGEEGEAAAAAAEAERQRRRKQRLDAVGRGGGGADGGDDDVAARQPLLGAARDQGGSAAAWVAPAGAPRGGEVAVPLPAGGAAAAAAEAAKEAGPRRRRRVYLPLRPFAVLCLLTAAVAVSDVTKGRVYCGSWQVGKECRPAPCWSRGSVAEGLLAQGCSLSWPRLDTPTSCC
jgi:hypothetical protein